MSLFLILSLTSANAFELPLSKVAQTVAKVSATALIAGTIATAPAFASGKSIFEGNCAACHYGGMNVIMPDKTLEKEVR